MWSRVGTFPSGDKVWAGLPGGCLQGQLWIWTCLPKPGEAGIFLMSYPQDCEDPRGLTHLGLHDVYRQNATGQSVAFKNNSHCEELLRSAVLGA